MLSVVLFIWIFVMLGLIYDRLGDILKELQKGDDQ